MKFIKHEIERHNGNHWKGGRVSSVVGYIYIRVPSHPKNYNGYVAEHRVVMENSIGRYLKNGEVIHHINGIKNDNRIENLVLCSSNSEHGTYHRKYKEFNRNNAPTPLIKGEKIKIITGVKSRLHKCSKCIKCKKLFWMNMELNNIGYCSHKCANERKFSRR